MKRKNSHKVPAQPCKPEVTLAAVVKEAVRRYRRDCWWADPEDLSQQAWITALEATKTFKPEMPGASLYWYAWRAVVIQLRNYLWRQSAPVTAPQRKLTELAGIRRAPLDESPEEGHEGTPERLLARAQLARRVRAAVEELEPELSQRALEDEDARALKTLAGRAAKAGIMRSLHIHH